MAAAAGRAGLDAPVSPCAPWRIKNLLRHTGFIHRWAAGHIVSPSEHVRDGPSEEEIRRGGAPDAELLDWFRDGHAALVQALQGADPALETATFLAAPSPLAFWARLQAHETAIHRADAETAAGDMPSYRAEFAADGIDELIMGFGRGSKYRPQAGQPGTLRILGADTGDSWLVRVEDGRCQPELEPAPAEQADCVVSGTASHVYLFLWNRAPAQGQVAITGDPAVLDLWKSGVRVR